MDFSIDMVSAALLYWSFSALLEHYCRLLPALLAYKTGRFRFNCYGLLWVGILTTLGYLSWK